jgi:hypothetical protein
MADRSTVTIDNAPACERSRRSAQAHHIAAHEFEHLSGIEPASD